MTESMPTESSRTRSSSTDRVRVETRGEDTVVASVTVDAARSVVFTAFTDPVVLARWFWPHRFGTRVECDLGPGGSFAIRAAGLPAGEELGASGTYQEVQAPARSTMSWQWAGESAISQVAIELSDIAAKPHRGGRHPLGQPHDDRPRRPRPGLGGLPGWTAWVGCSRPSNSRAHDHRPAVRIGRSMPARSGAVPIPVVPRGFLHVLAQRPHTRIVMATDG